MASSNVDTNSPKLTEICFFDKVNFSNMSVNLYDFQKKSEFCDVILDVENVLLPVHRCVLAAFSPYFKTMFQSEFVEAKQAVVNVTNFKPDTMKSLICYAYTSVITITLSNCQDLISAADILQLSTLLEAAYDFLESHIDEHNCLGIIHFAKSLNCEVLLNKAFNLALENFETVIKGEEFLEIPAATLINIISDDKLNVASEETVFEAVKTWYTEYPKEREDHLYSVMQNVRFPFTDFYFLKDCPEYFPAIKEKPEIMELIEEAKDILMLPDRNTEISNIRMKPRNVTELIQVIVVIGGLNSRGCNRHTSIVRCLSLENNEWFNLASLSIFRSNCAVAVSEKKLFFAGGFDQYSTGTTSNTCKVYDPFANMWCDVTSMRVPRQNFGMASLDGYLYAVGGLNGAERLNSIERYDSRTKTWSIKKHLNTPLSDAAVIACQRMLYVAGGSTSNSNECNCFWGYDPTTNAWKQLPALLTTRSKAAACVLENFIYIIGGLSGGEHTNWVDRYDVKNDKWEETTSMMRCRSNPGVAVLDNRIYVFGGFCGTTIHAEIEYYDPTKNTWTLFGNMPSAITKLSCATMMVKSTFCKK